MVYCYLWSNSIISDTWYNTTFYIDSYFFNDGDPYDYFLHPEYYKRLLGTFKEPSFCSTFLVGAMYYVLLMKHYLKKWKVLFSLLGIDLILTMSSTGYGSFLLSVLFICFINENLKFSIYY